MTSPAAIGVHDVEQGIVAVELIGDLDVSRLDEVVPRVSTRVEEIRTIKAGELGSFAAGPTPGQAAR